MFSPTALYNFELSRFLEKWLRDVKAEQLPTGGIPNTVPVQATVSPPQCPRWPWTGGATPACWCHGLYTSHGQPGCAAYDVPHHAEVRQGVLFLGRVRHRQAPLYLAHAVGAAFWRLGRPRCAEDESVAGPQQVHRYGLPVQHQRYTGENCTHLGKTEDAAKYKELSRKVADAYCSVLTDGSGKTKEEFQTAYVLPLYLNMFPENVKAKAGRESGQAG